MCVRQYRPVRPGTISVELLRRDRKLNSRWKVKPRDGKNKDGEREQDKEEVRVPEGTVCSLVKFGLKTSVEDNVF